MNDQPEHCRLFIAIEIPEQVKTALEQAQTGLRRALPGTSVRWAKRDQFHLTLRFLGDVEVQRTEALIAAVRRACQAFSQLQIHAARVGFFPDTRFPRVVWAGVHDQLPSLQSPPFVASFVEHPIHNQLPSLQRALQDATESFTTERPEAQFTGHVTLGRIKSLRRPQAETLVKAAATLTDQVFGAWTAREVAIMCSELSPSGAIHSTLAVAPLVLC